jgi:hypothetical protein
VTAVVVAVTSDPGYRAAAFLVAAVMLGVAIGVAIRAGLAKDGDR